MSGTQLIEDPKARDEREKPIQALPRIRFKMERIRMKDLQLLFVMDLYIYLCWIKKHAFNFQKSKLIVYIKFLDTSDSLPVNMCFQRKFVYNLDLL